MKRFATVPEISKNIVDALKVRLLAKELETITKRGTDNPEAYQIYLMGRSFFNRGHESRNMKAARHLFAKAIEVDPLYARAYAGLADCDSYLLFANDPTATLTTSSPMPTGHWSLSPVSPMHMHRAALQCSPKAAAMRQRPNLSARSNWIRLLSRQTSFMGEIATRRASLKRRAASTSAPLS
jgi:hypothetical protein